MVFQKFLLLWFLCLLIWGQKLSDLEKKCLNPPLKPSSKNKYSFVKWGTNDLTNVFNALFLIYKIFFSAYDIGQCSFVPSCSEYMFKSIRKYGFFTGYLNGLDRLTRCNSLHPEKYLIDKETMKFYDPP